MAEPFADTALTWQCSCGNRTWAHVLHCACGTALTWQCSCGRRTWSHVLHCACGNARPEPPPDAEPSDASRPDPLPPLTGGMTWA